MFCMNQFGEYDERFPFSHAGFDNIALYISDSTEQRLEISFPLPNAFNFKSESGEAETEMITHHV